MRKTSIIGYAERVNDKKISKLKVDPNNCVQYNLFLNSHLSDRLCKKDKWQKDKSIKGRAKQDIKVSFSRMSRYTKGV